MKKQRAAERRKLEKEAERLDRLLAELQREKSALAERLADPALYSDRIAAAALAVQDAELSARIETAETRWLEVHEALESLTAE